MGVDYSPWRRREESGGSIGVDEGGNERTNERRGNLLGLSGLVVGWLSPCIIRYCACSRRGGIVALRYPLLGSTVPVRGRMILFYWSSPSSSYL